MLQIVPVILKYANEFILKYHRHHKPVIGHKFSIGVGDENQIRGVIIIGRPIARLLDNGLTLEVTRCCTDGVPNGCSMLYGAAWRATRALGYKRLITYILPEEGGASLRAAGWRLIGECGGGTWNRKNRPRINTHPLGKKLRYEAI